MDVAPDAIEIPAAGKEEEIKCYAHGTEWTGSVAITEDPNNMLSSVALDKGYLHFTVAENTIAEARQATVTVTLKKEGKTDVVMVIEIDQKAASVTPSTGSGTLSDPYTVAGVFAYMDSDKYNAETEVFVKGYVCDPTTPYNSSKNQATFWLADEVVTEAGHDLTKHFEAYYVGYFKEWGEPGDYFEGDPNIALGKEVILVGKAVKFVKDETTTYEMTGKDGAFLVSLDGVTELDPVDMVFAGATGYHLRNWRRVSKYCGCCGAATVPSETERAFVCSKCGYTFERPGKFCPKCGAAREAGQ